MFGPENDGSFYGENEAGIPGTAGNHLSKDSLWTMTPFSSRNKSQSFALCLPLEPWPDVKPMMEFITVSFGWALFQECPCAFVMSWFPGSEVTLAFPVSCLSAFQLNASERGVNRVLMPVAMIGGTEHENYNRESFIHEASMRLALPRTRWSIISLLYNRVTRKMIWEHLPSESLCLQWVKVSPLHTI